MRILFFLIQLYLVTAAYAQKVQKVTATYTYHVPENVTVEQAKRTALERAKIQAIADEFGIVVTQNNSTVISNQNGETDNRFLSFSGSEVKGEWIETTKEPQYEISYESDMLVVTVTVIGHIREITHASIDFKASVLRNGTEELFESNEFRDGDDLYLSFCSPVNGYLVVYLLDETVQEVYCLLPYQDSGEGAYHIEHDRNYILFSTKNETTNPSIVNEYTLTCNQVVEFNDLYIIFSSNPFVKAVTNESIDELLPRQLSYNGFQKWLAKIRSKDKAIRVEVKQIKISQRDK